MKNTVKKILSLIMALVLCFSLLPMQALAEEAGEAAAAETAAEEPAAADEPVAEETLPEEPAAEETLAEVPDGEIVPEPAPETEGGETTGEENPIPEPAPEEIPSEEEPAVTLPAEEEPAVTDEAMAETLPEEEADEELPEEPEVVYIEEGPETEVYVPEPGELKDDLFEGYVDKVLYSGRRRAAGPQSAVGETLTGLNYQLYYALVGEITQVAEGQRTSTEFQFPIADMGVTVTQWTAEELGVSAIVENGAITEEAKAAVNALYPRSTSIIVKALLADCPFELYWFDKTVGVSSSGYTYSASYSNKQWTLTISGNFTFRLAVAGEYAAETYVTDPTTGTTVQYAKGRAQSIVGNNAGLSDVDKLVAYKETIRSLSTYNSGAAGGGAPYGNPWQLIWVFDDDPSTTVVCEGFSKAFQYLCELTDFDGPITCVSAYGTMTSGSQGGNHMWNIVTMEDGKNYLCDVTNCGLGGAGPDARLFLRGYDSGNIDDGYVFSNITYRYETNCRAIFPDSTLTLSDTTYVRPATQEWADPVYDWATDNSSVTATRVCLSDSSLTVTETVNTTYAVTTPAGCESTGVGTYTATFTNSVFTTQTKEITLSATGHAWSEVSYIWATDNSSVTATRTCGNDATHVQTETVSSSYAVTTAAGCETTGIGTYTATFTNSAFTTQTKEITLSATGHTWGEVSYTWANDNSTATASRSCGNDETHVQTETVNSSYAVTTPAGCETTGIGTYTATFTNSAFAEQTKEVTISATGHAWGEVSYTWANDNSTATATRTCGNNATHIQTETVNSSYAVTTAAGCETTGIGTYTATFTNSAFAEQTKEVTISATGHAWGEVSYDWATDNSSVTATRTCGNDATHVQTETVSSSYAVTTPAGCETTGVGTYTATFTNSAFTTQTKEITLSATGHTWGEVSYTWANDNSTATASRTCGNNATHVQTETVNSSYAVTTPAGCETTGVGTYTATFTNSAFSKQTKLIELPATGHAWGEVSYVWADDNSTVTASRTCGNEATHVETEEVSSSYAVTTEPGCETAGVGTYTATFTNPAFAEQKKEVSVAAAGHTWGEAEYTWLEGNSSVVAERVCTKDSSHVETETVETSSVSGIDGTDLVTTWTATFTNEAFETQIKEERSALHISRTTMDLYVDYMDTLLVIAQSGSVAEVTWVSSKPDVASVTEAGLVRGLKSGLTTVSALDGQGNTIASCAVRVLFTDVADPSRYFYEPVYWALENNITTGAGGPGLFSPNNDCTREQIVTFLWRLMGEPEPSYYTPFTDVPQNAWYYKPISWAAEMGITVGLNDGTGRFGVGQACTRAMCVTFLWRAAGKPAPHTQGNFTDMKPGAYYVDAVSWAAENNITVGLNDGTGRFGINNSCTRAMIVTFLYRFAHMS